MFHDTGVPGGIRIAYRGAARVSPFWQVVGGGLHSKGDGYYYESVRVRINMGRCVPFHAFIARPTAPR